MTILLGVVSGLGGLFALYWVLRGWAVIFRRVGYTGWLAPLMVIPVVDFFAFLWLAFLARWPKIPQADKGLPPEFRESEAAQVAKEPQPALPEKVRSPRRTLFGVIVASLFVLALGVAALAAYGGFALATDESGDCEARLERCQETAGALLGDQWSSTECSEARALLGKAGRRDGPGADGVAELQIAINDRCD